MSSREANISNLTVKVKPCSAINYDHRCEFSARKFYKESDGLWYPLCMPHYRHKVGGSGLEIHGYANATGMSTVEKTAWIAARKRKLKERPSAQQS